VAVLRAFSEGKHMNKPSMDDDIGNILNRALACPFDFEARWHASAQGKRSSENERSLQGSASRK
jgi:hypothetical protein